MIDMGTLMLIDKLNQLAEKSKGGIKSVKEYDPNVDCIYYDEKNSDEKDYFPVALDIISDVGEYDVASRYDDDDPYKIRAFDDGGEKPYVVVIFEDVDIVIEDGKWYFTNYVPTTDDQMIDILDKMAGVIR